MKLEKIIAVRTDKTVYRDGDLAVKVFGARYNKADILNEALNQARVEEIGLNVPRVEEVCKIDGKWAIVTDYIEGKTLQRLMDENPDKFDEYLEQFVDLQLEVQRKTCPMLNSLTEKMQKKISQADLDATCRYELHTRLAAMPKHNKVCHGDFNPSNIIITEEGKAYILDWLEGNIEGAEKYLNLFCKKSDTAKQYVQKWIPIVAASQSVKGKPEEKEFLLRWADVVDYE